MKVMRSAILFLSAIQSWAVVAAQTDVSNDDCGLYLSHSEDGSFVGLFAGRSLTSIGEVLGTGEELVLPILNANKNEYSPWHSYVWDSGLLTVVDADEDPAVLTTDIFISGLGAMVVCSETPNLRPAEHRIHIGSNNASSALTSGFRVELIAPVEPGEALTIDCGQGGEEESNNESIVIPMAFLREEGVCVDTLIVQKSEIEGRGAFSKRAVAKGGVVTTTPVVHFDRSQTEIVAQQYKPDIRDRVIPLIREHGIEYNATQVLDKQLLINYCYGSPLSNVLLLPMGPGVNFINHSSKKPNVEIRWSEFNDATETREELPVMELFEQPAGLLVIEYVALTDIQAGDEILLNYGSAWEEAWANHDPSRPFRHEIEVPSDLYSRNWDKQDPKPYGDFIASPLSTGHMAPIRWRGSGTSFSAAEIVTPWAFRLGLHSQVRQVLLDYCNAMGITDILRHVTVEGNGLQPGTETHMNVQGDDWYLQRPAASWRSNLHWFSPGAGPAHEHYLQALSVAGFDEILDGIGQYLGMDGLVAFHVTFIGVSFSTRGYLHHDVVETSGKVYNVIIPLMLANETGPELDLCGWKPDAPGDDEYNSLVGRYRYEYDVASMMGDGAVHATSACDYRNTKQMRMAATVYIADVNDDNIDNVMNHYTQAYPPPDEALLRSWIGRHWRQGDPTRSLPKPPPSHILYNYSKLLQGMDDVQDEL